MGFIGLVADAATTIQQETGEITRFFSIAHVKQLLNDLGNWSVSLIGKIVIAVLIWFIGKKIIRVLDKLVKKILDRSTLDKGVVNFVVSVLKFVMYAILIMIVVDKLGFQTTSLLTLFGSAALAIGMSLQGSLSNFAGGILILIFKPFKVGDYIIVGTNEGTVKSIEILYTRLVTIDNKVVMLPNGSLSNSSIVNVGAENTRRIDIQIGIGYSSDIPKAKKLLEQVINSEKGILKDKDILVVVKSLDESCVTLETRAWVNTADYWNVRFNLLERYNLHFFYNLFYVRHLYNSHIYYIINNIRKGVVDMVDNNTQFFKTQPEKTISVEGILEQVYLALKEKGYNPVNQIVGYIMSGDPTYITSHNNARSLIMKAERDELVEEVVRYFIEGKGL